MITEAEPAAASAAAPRGRLGTLLRYTAGSIVATLVSQVAFVLVFRVFDAGPTIATIAAFLAGAVPNYVLNKRWAWQDKGAGSRAELVRYIAVIVVTTGAAVLTTHVADDWVSAHVVSSDVRTLVVDLVYLATYGVMFVLKYLLFDGLVFNRRSRSRRTGAPEDSPTR